MNSVIIWVQLNEEQDYLENVLADKCFSIRGTTPLEKKVEYEERWRHGERPILITKASVMGWGLNWQHCHYMIFCGMNYSYESYYQAVRRCYRYGQTMPVDVVKVIGENEKNILDTVERKADMKKTMSISMASAMRDLQSNEIKGSQFHISFDKQTTNFPDWLRSELV